MATIPREFVDRYADALEKLSDEMKRRLVKDLERIDWTAPVAEIREALIPIMQAYCGASADSAATLAAEFYDGMSEQMTGINPRAVLAPDYSDNAVEQFVRGAVQSLVDNGPSASSVVMNKMASRVGYEVKHAAGNTVIRNGVRDSRRVRFARVPRGSKSYPHGCPFCQMLASRGFAYRTAATAGEMNHYHDNCQCMVVPGFGANPKVEGYDPEEYLDRWQHPEKYKDEASTQNDKTAQSAPTFKPLIGREFSGAADIQEATERAKQFVDLSAYKSKIDLRGMNIDAANSLLKPLEAVFDAYDIDPLRSIQRMNKRSAQFKNTSAEAAYQWMIGDLFYNSDYVKTAKAMAAHRAEGKKLVDDVLSMDIEAYIRKNAGNTRKVRYAEALRDTGRPLVALSYDAEYEELVYAHELGHMLDDRVFRKIKSFDRQASFEQYSARLSAYATADVKEYMAESFCAFYAGEIDNLDPDLARLFTEAMK